MSERVVVGRVGRPHGVAGAFVVEEASEDASWFARGARLLVGGDTVEVVESKRGSRGRPVIRLDREVSRGTSLEVDRSALPPTEEDEYYVFELVGLDVVEETGRGLGKVADVTSGVANDVLELDSGRSLPMVEDCVRRIDLEAGRILVASGFSDPD